MIRLAVLDGLVLSYARALQKQNINYQEYLLVDVTDISDICVYMTYIQLALYGVPAIVRCGNTLTQEMRFKLETPLFFLHYSKFRKFYMKNKNKIKKNIFVINKSKKKNQNLFKEVTIKGNCQITLW